MNPIAMALAVAPCLTPDLSVSIARPSAPRRRGGRRPKA